MIAPLDFSLTPAVLSALVAAAGLPLYLALAARVPGLAGRTATHFLIAWLAMVGIWGLGVARWPGPGRLSAPEVAVALMLLGAGSLAYLEAWGLLSRGYTLGLLLTLYRADRPLGEKDLADRYRGGEGLDWLIRHRLRGLKAAGLVREQDEVVILTPVLGVGVAWLYRLSIAFLGLRGTG